MKYAAQSFGCNRASSRGPLLVSQLGTPSAPLGGLTSSGDQIDKEVFMRMLSFEIKSQTLCPQQRADQKECGAARGCGA